MSSQPNALRLVSQTAFSKTITPVNDAPRRKASSEVTHGSVVTSASVLHADAARIGIGAEEISSPCRGSVLQSRCSRSVRSRGPHLELAPGARGGSGISMSSICLLLSRDTPTIMNSRASEPLFTKELISFSWIGMASPLLIDAVSDVPLAVAVVTVPVPFIT